MFFLRSQILNFRPTIILSFSIVPYWSYQSLCFFSPLSLITCSRINTLSQEYAQPCQCTMLSDELKIHVPTHNCHRDAQTEGLEALRALRYWDFYRSFLCVCWNIFYVLSFKSTLPTRFFQCGPVGDLLEGICT